MVSSSKLALPGFFAALTLSAGFNSAVGAQLRNLKDATTMSFFITSVGSGDGGNLGGLEGADAHCTMLAETAGVMGQTWHAYLSSSTENAAERIGTGPWYNADGVMVATNVETLHDQDSPDFNLGKETSIDETGALVNGADDDPNTHDILTGSDEFGMLTGEACMDWTTNEGSSANVGHHDLQGGGDNPTSWNAAHASAGCSQADLEGTGGFGLFYCFAVDGMMGPTMAPTMAPAMAPAMAPGMAPIMPVDEMPPVEITGEAPLPAGGERAIPADGPALGPEAAEGGEGATASAIRPVAAAMSAAVVFLCAVLLM